MEIMYNIDPITALEIFYEGEYHGVYKGDFIKNEKKRGLTLPPMLREFLEKFGYLSVNEGGVNSFRLYHPDDMVPIALSDGEGGEIHIIVIGTLTSDKSDEDDGNFDDNGESDNEDNEEVLFIGVRPDTPDFEMAMGQVSDEGADWWPMGRTLSGLLFLMFLSVLGRSCDCYVFDKPSEIKAVLKQHGFDVHKADNSNWASVHYDEDSGEFIVTEFEENIGSINAVRIVPRDSGGEAEARSLKEFSFDELTEMFTMEFYANSLNCDFERCLEIQTEIGARLKAGGADDDDMLKHHKIMGRCYWALERYDEADAEYAEMLRLSEDDPAELADAYSVLCSYYFDLGRISDSDRMFEKELTLRRETEPDNCYDIGMIFGDRAKRLEGDDSQLDRLIELCELALEEFGKDPHDSGCKYEIARMQQLRGNARRRKKELAKNQ